MTRREQESARKRLKLLGLLEEDRRGVPARMWYRINVKAVVEILRSRAKSLLVRNVPTRRRKTCQPEGAEEPDKKGGKRPTISKTSLQTSLEISADDASAAALVKELVSHDLNRGDAVRLVREKPEECRRQVEYLDFLIQRNFVFKKSKPGFLRTAIESENGPPTGYLEEKAREGKLKKQQEREAAQASKEVARRTYQEAQEVDYLAYLASRIADVEKSQPQAFMAFTEAEGKRRAFYTKTFPGRLSQFDTNRAYLIRFAEHFAGNADLDVLGFWEWDRNVNRMRNNPGRSAVFHAWNNPRPQDPSASK